VAVEAAAAVAGAEAGVVEAEVVEAEGVAEGKEEEEVSRALFLVLFPVSRT
jgi:hypothetical protein